MFTPTQTGASERAGQRGGSKLNTLITLAIVGALAFIAVKIVPVYVNNYQFQDSIESESRFALSSYPKKSVDDIRDDVFKKVQELGIPAKEEDIQVTVNNTDVDIGLDYSVPIDLAVYQFTLQFHPHADNHSI
jgi:YbbR domain-containing protein